MENIGGLYSGEKNQDRRIELVNKFITETENDFDVLDINEAFVVLAVRINSLTETQNIDRGLLLAKIQKTVGNAIERHITSSYKSAPKFKRFIESILLVKSHLDELGLDLKQHILNKQELVVDFFQIYIYYIASFDYYKLENWEKRDKIREYYKKLQELGISGTYLDNSLSKMVFKKMGIFKEGKELLRNIHFGS